MKINKDELFNDIAESRFQDDIHLPLMEYLLSIKYYRYKKFLFWKYKKYISLDYSIEWLRLKTQVLNEVPDYIEVEYLYKK